MKQTFQLISFHNSINEKVFWDWHQNELPPVGKVAANIQNQKSNLQNQNTAQEVEAHLNLGLKFTSEMEQHALKM